MTRFVVFANSSITSIMRVPEFESFEDAWTFMQTYKWEPLNEKFFKMNCDTHEESFVKDRSKENPHVWFVGLKTSESLLLTDANDTKPACIMAIPYSFLKPAPLPTSSSSSSQ